jgi:hypothetical protein
MTSGLSRWNSTGSPTGRRMGHCPEHLLSVVAMQGAHPLSSGSSHQDPRDIPFSHVSYDFCEWHVGTDSARSGLHDPIDGRLRGGAKGVAAEVTQENTDVVQHHTGLSARCVYPVL